MIEDRTRLTFSMAVHLNTLLLASSVLYVDLLVLDQKTEGVLAFVVNTLLGHVHQQYRVSQPKDV